MFAQGGPPRYRAYLLRCWEVRSEKPGRPSTWRFSLEQAGTGERHGFRDLESLVAFVRAELGRNLPGADGAGRR